jgi:hypothetical protein
MLGFVADSTISQFFPRSQLEQEKERGTYFVAHSIRKAWSCAPAPIHSQHAIFPFPAKLKSQFKVVLNHGKETSNRSQSSLSKYCYKEGIFCISYILGTVSFLLTSLRTKRNKVCYSSSRKKVKKVYSCSLPFDWNTYPQSTPSAEPEKKFRQLTVLRSSYLKTLTMERNPLDSPSSPFMHLNKEKKICCKSHIPPLFQFPFQ